jgi:5'-3' exoribonuclease 1
MGIPSYFSYIIKNYSNIIRNLTHFAKNKLFRFHYLYMDCNSIIYDSVRELETANRENHIKMSIAVFEDALIERVVRAIDCYIQQLSPDKVAYVAFDGVAPFAKMIQQRCRRYKSQYVSTLSFQHSDTGEEKWNTSHITPGTPFMKKLSVRVSAHYSGSDKHWGCAVITSCSDECGEGEHKMFQHLREHVQLSDNVAVYGLDADLIMLSLFHCRFANNIYVFREAPEFLKSSIPLKVQSNVSNLYFLDIQLLSSGILSEMDCAYFDKQRIYDYLFICFLLGNDFLPHFPALNIRTHGVKCLLDSYRKVIGSKRDVYLVAKDTNSICWSQFGLLLEDMSKREHLYFLEESNARSKWDKRRCPETTPKEKEDCFQNAPMYLREEEKYICPEEAFWESRYYKILLGCKREPGNVERICVSYLENIEWVLSYYMSACVDWRKGYLYNYAPLLVDLQHYAKLFNGGEVSKRGPVSDIEQLSYVLPPALSDHSVPLAISKAYCRYTWEGNIQKVVLA